jgi:glycosidase
MASTFEFRNGPMALRFDEATGALVRIQYGERVIAETSADVPPISVLVGTRTSTASLEEMGLTRTVVTRSSPSPDVLGVTVRVGDYEIVERYRLFADRPRLDRSVRLIYRGTETQQLRGLVFRTAGVKATPDGSYRFPKSWPPQGRRFADMVAGREQQSPWGTLDPLLAQFAPNETVLWVSYGDDTPQTSVTEGDGTFEVRQSQDCQGWLKPGQPQDIGFVTMEVIAADYWGALPHLWEWMDSVGMRVPADRPDWIAEARLYSFHPGGTIGSDFHDLGGFRAAMDLLLPALRRLNITAIWMLPVEEGTVYNPWDFYGFMEGLGTGEEYRALVKQAHEMGYHVLQDSVPHGGLSNAPHNVAHPEWLVRREDGTVAHRYMPNDYADPEWQQFMARVSDHWVREYDVDGFRIDSAGGSSSYNWTANPPYQRASLAGMNGGLKMVQAIRDAAKRAKPAEGATLAEVESPRVLAISDLDYDFNFGITLCHAFRQMPAAEFVAAAQEYLEEERYCNPRGARHLRMIETGDMLRSQYWYGVNGMRALYALSAWIDGVPVVYQDQDRGHGLAIREIHDLRQQRPELAKGESYYRAVSCDTPGIFTVLRKLGQRQSVVAINFNRDPRTVRLAWPGGQAQVRLGPLQYAVFPQLPKQLAPASPTKPAAGAPEARVTEDVIAFPRAEEWFVDTVEGRLRDQFFPLRGRGQSGRARSLYWRQQGTDDLWLNETQPLHPREGRVGVRGPSGSWTIVRFEGPVTQPVRLVERLDGQAGLHLVGLSGATTFVSSAESIPPEPEAAVGCDIGGVHLRVVGPDYIVSTGRYTAMLRRQGGVIRELWRGGQLLAKQHDIYAEGKDFTVHGQWATDERMNAASDVECGIRIDCSPRGELVLAFQGQVRGFQDGNRYGLREPALWYRNEYVFGESGFVQRWAFRSDGDRKGQQGMVGASFLVPSGVSAGGQLGDTAAVPTRIDLLTNGRVVLSLDPLRVPSTTGARVYERGNELVIAIAEGDQINLDANTWYECEARWEVAGGAR